MEREKRKERWRERKEKRERGVILFIWTYFFLILKIHFTYKFINPEIKNKQIYFLI
jgi:hypothetical protein